MTRAELRARLTARRDAAAASADAATALASLTPHLRLLLSELKPESLGLYWPIRSEFDIATACIDDPALAQVPFALPFSRRVPCEMVFRRWDRATPRVTDEYRVPSADGDPLVPDVALVPCLGFTADGFRIGYGGGFYDRYLARHPHVTTIGIAWHACRVGSDEFQPQAHDVAITLVLTEKGVATS